MRKLLLIISLFLFSSSFAYNISYEFKIEITTESGGIKTKTLISLGDKYSGTISEGEVFTVPAFTLPDKYSSLQDEYNVISGATFSIPHDALENDIKLIITLAGLNAGKGGYGLLNGHPLFLKLKIDVYSPATSETPIEGHFFFKNNKRIIFSMPRQPYLDNYLNSLTLSPRIIAFAFAIENLCEVNGITTMVTDDSVSFSAEHLSTIVGSNKDIVSVKEEHNLGFPKIYALKQNYPNPFNPATNINFSIPVDGFVTLKVYNALGAEITTLISKNMTAGNYEITFNTNNLNLSSGIYFYTLTGNNNITLTKKMILLK